MSATIDERIVEMTFKGTTFAEGVAGTIKALGTLKTSLGSLKGSESDLNQLDAAGKKFSLAGISSGVQSVASKFSAMGIVGITVLSNIVNKAVDAGISIAKSLTIDPIKQGLEVYETKINAIQTILANTSSSGTTLKQVTAALNELNVYANKTVYNFGQMAQNIGTFTAAGVGLKESVSSIKGIANLAALSGSSAEQASSAMYQLSQAIAAGRVKLQDWNSVVNAGLGGKVFQNALIQDARAHGVAIDAMIKKDNGFRNTLQTGWLTSKILTDTLSTFTGDLNEAQLRGMGYTKAETEAIIAQAKEAVKSATQIRTITQLQAALREEVATAWSQVWESIIGNIGTASTLLTSVHNTLENAFTKPVYDLNNILKAFDALGGRDDVIRTIVTAFRNLDAILKPIREAFSDVFPPVTAVTLLKIVIVLEDLVAKMKISATTADELRKTFDGIFSVFKIVLDVIGGVAHAIGIMFGSAGKTGDNVLALTSRLGSFISNIRKTIETGDGLTKFFGALGNVLALPVKAIDKVTGSLGGLVGIITKVVGFIKPFIAEIGTEFGKLGDAIAKGLSSGSFSNIVNLVNQVLIGGVLVSIRKFISNLGKGGEEKTGLFDTIKESFESLTGALKTMQTALKSETLEKIAIAVALLVASIVALSFIDVKNLTKSVAAITILFGELVLAMAAVARISGSAGILKMAAIGIALNLLATAILILVGAVAILAHFSWEQLERGLGAVAVLLGILVTASTLMSSNVKGLVASAYSMEIMAVALNILAAAVGKLGKLDFKTLVKGIGSIAALLVILGAFNKLGGGESLIVTAASMLILGAALTVIAKVVVTLGSLSVSQLAKGLIGIAGALLIIAAAMTVMPPDMLLTAASLLLVAAALVVLSKALVTMGSLTWVQIAKSLVLLAGALVIIAAAMIAMTEALPGAAALIVVAGALALLTPVLVAFSQLSWEGIVKALITLAGAFVIIAAAGILLTPLIPSLLGVGVAITLLGVGILAAGAGVALFAVGLTALAVAVTASGAAILSFVTSIIGLIPAVLKQLGAGVLAFADVIGKGGPAITRAFVALLSAILEAITKIIPKAVKAFGVLLDGLIVVVGNDAPRLVVAIAKLLIKMLNTIAKYAPNFVTAGVHLIVSVLSGIASNVGRIVTAAGGIAISFINAIGREGLAIERAGANMLIMFINGLAGQIRSQSPRLDAAGANLALAIIQGMSLGLLNGLPSIASAAVNIASTALNSAKNWLLSHSPSKKFQFLGEDSGQGLADGLNNSVGVVAKAGAGLADSALSTVKDSLSGLSDLVNETIDVNPTITPILDLSVAKKGFDDLAGMSKSQLINATASSSTATSISASNAAAATAAGISATGSKSLTFNQYNTSPTALSNADIYRQTKNQLSIAKGALP